MKTTKEIFMMNENNESTYRGFTEYEWITIDNALEALLTEMEESKDPDFAHALENIFFAYDLCEDMMKEVVDQYNNFCNTQYSDFHLWFQ